MVDIRVKDSGGVWRDVAGTKKGAINIAPNVGPWKDTTVAASGTTTDMVDLGDIYEHVQLLLPSMTGTAITVHAAPEPGGTFIAIAPSTSTNTTGSSFVLIPIGGQQYIKLVCSAAQAGARAIRVRGFNGNLPRFSTRNTISISDETGATIAETLGTQADAIADTYNSLFVSGFTYAHNGSNWDRIQNDVWDGGTIATTKIGILTLSGMYAWDGTIMSVVESDVWDGGTIATTAKGIKTLSLLYGYDGTIARALTTRDGTGNLQVHVLAGDQVIRAADPSNDGGVVTGYNLATGAMPMLFNGTSIDRQRTVEDRTLLASAARTATTNSSDQTNYNARGVIITLDVTAATDTPSITLQVEHKDGASGKYEKLFLTDAAVTAIGTHTYIVYPGVGAAADDVVEVQSYPLGRTWRVTVTHADADSITYTVGATLLY